MNFHEEISIFEGFRIWGLTPDPDQALRRIRIRISIPTFSKYIPGSGSYQANRTQIRNFFLLQERGNKRLLCAAQLSALHQGFLSLQVHNTIALSWICSNSRFRWNFKKNHKNITSMSLILDSEQVPQFWRKQVFSEKKIQICDHSRSRSNKMH